LDRVIKDSELITVILISSGDSKIRGTPFDEQINAAYQQSHDQQQKARMPFVTVLRAKKGRAAEYVVNTPPWPLQIPRLVQETNVAETLHEKLREAVRQPPTSNVPPLIISGKKPPPEQPPAPKTDLAPAKPAVTPAVVTVAVTNEPATTKAPEPVAPPTEIAKAEPAPLVPIKSVTEPPPTPVPAPAKASESKQEPAKGGEATAVATAPAQPEPTPPAPAPKPGPAPVATEPPKPPAVTRKSPETSPAPAAIQDPAVTKASDVAAAQTTTSRASSPVAASSSTPKGPAQSATAIPAESLLRSRNILIAALLLAVVAIGVVLLFLRRSRAAPQTSFITRSFEREKGP
jgi:hypothetical protein